MWACSKCIRLHNFCKRIHLFYQASVFVEFLRANSVSAYALDYPSCLLGSEFLAHKNDDSLGLGKSHHAGPLRTQDPLSDANEATVWALTGRDKRQFLQADFRTSTRRATGSETPNSDSPGGCFDKAEHTPNPTLPTLRRHAA